MIAISSLRHLSRVIKKPQALLCNLLLNPTSKCVFFHESKLLSNDFKIEIKMPSLSPTMTEGTIIKWLKKEGDSIEPGDVLCEIQTDKAVVGLETEEEGVLEKIIIPENTQNIQLGELIAIISGEGTITENITQMPPTAVECEKTVQMHDVPKNTANDLIGPSVKKLLHEFNISYSDVPSSGPRNNLLKGDVLKFIKDHNLKPFKTDISHKTKEVVSSKTNDAYIDIPVTSTEMESALQCSQSKRMMPHGYMSIDCKVDNTLKYILKYFKEDVSLNEFIIKSAITALKRVPVVNTSRCNGQLQSPKSIHVSFTNFNNGKYETYLIKDQDGLHVQSISEQLRGHNRIPSEGVFQISSLGSFGISNFVEVISQGNLATLTTSGIMPIFEEGSMVRKMRVTLSFDSFVVGETDAGKFLETFKNCLENPLILMC